MASNLRYKPPGVQDPGAGSVALSGYPGFGFPPVTMEDVIVASVMWGFFTVLHPLRKRKEVKARAR